MLWAFLRHQFRKVAPRDPPLWLVLPLAALVGVNGEAIVDERVDALQIENAYLVFLMWVALSAVLVAVFITATWVTYNALRALVTRRRRALGSTAGRRDAAHRGDR